MHQNKHSDLSGLNRRIAYTIRLLRKRPQIPNIKIELSAVIFYLYMLMPAVYLIGFPGASRKWRLYTLGVIAFASLLSASVRKDVIESIKQLPLFAKFLIGAIFVAIIYSTKLGLTTNRTIITGIMPEYLGLIAWLLFLITGLLLMPYNAKYILSRASLYITSLLLAISLIADRFYIGMGLRVAGVMFQPTSMAMFATFSAVLCLHHLFAKSTQKLKFLHGSLLVLATTTIMLCQSRVAYIVLALVLVIWIIRNYRHNFARTVFVFVMLCFLAIMPRIASGYFSRFHTESVNRGVNYRLDLYKTSLFDLVHRNRNTLHGNGPSTLPTAINNQNTVPEEIAKSLGLGYTFLSTHDLFFDFAYFFGCLASIALITLTFWSGYYGYEYGGKNRLTLLVVLAVVSINALVNIPSVELTSLFFVIMFGLLATKPHAQN